MTHATNIKITNDDENWEVEIKADIPAEAVALHRAHTLHELAGSVQLKGFRPGHVPESEIVRHLGEPEVMRRTAEHTVQHELPELLADKNILIVDTPRVTIEKIEPNAPLSFTARASRAPQVTLPDYKQLAKAHNNTKEAVEVTDTEHTEALTHFRREKVRVQKVELGAAPQDAHKESQDMDAKDLPELDDTFAQSIGYATIAEFQEKLREHMKTDKETRAREKHRATLLEKIVTASTMHYPANLREYELDDLEARLKGDLEQMKMTFEKYLEEIKKTREELRKEWIPAADSRVKVRLALAEMGRKESIEADPKTVEHEFEHAKRQYPNASAEDLHAHILHALRNEAVVSWLETIS